MAEQPPKAPSGEAPQVPVPAPARKPVPFTDEGTKSTVAAPSVAAVGSKPPPAAVGLRAAPKVRPSANEKAEAARTQARERVEAEKEERKQKVWDKLDSAKRQATEKLDRIRTFQPPKGGNG